MNAITIQPTVLSGKPGFMVGSGICGTRVFVESRAIAETLRALLVDEAAGLVTRDEGITVMNALIRDDETDAAARRADAPRCGYCGRPLPVDESEYCAICAVDVTHPLEGC